MDLKSWHGAKNRNVGIATSGVTVSIQIHQMLVKIDKKQKFLQIGAFWVKINHRVIQLQHNTDGF